MDLTRWMSVRSTSVVGLALLTTVIACSHSIAARGVTYTVSAADAETAARLERDGDVSRLPPAITPCAYWKCVAGDGCPALPREGAPLAEGSPTLRPWLAAKKEEACTVAGVSATSAGPCGAATPSRRRVVGAAPAFSRQAHNLDSADPGDFNGPPGMARRLPPDAVVDVTRLLQNARTGKCELAAVRIVDVGGAVAAGREYVVAVSQLSETIGATTSAQTAQKDREERQRAAQAMSEEEVRTGRCSDEHVEQLREAQSRIERVLGGLTTGPRDPVYTMTAHRFVVATKEGSGLSLDVLSPGENHLFVVSFNRETKLDVQDEQGYPVKLESPLEEAVRAASVLATDGRVVAANARSSIGMRVRGAGCTLVISVRKD